MQILGLFEIDFFTTPVQLLFTKNITKHFLLLYFALKQKMEQVLIFWIKPWSNPFEKCKFLRPFYIDVFYSQIKAFSFYNFSELFLLIHFALKQYMEKGLIFRQKPWLTPFVKMQILGFLDGWFYSLKRHLFFLELHKTLFTALFCIHTKHGKAFNFLTKAMD